MVELKEHNGVTVHGVSDASSDAENGGVFTLNSKNVRNYGKTSKMIEEMCDEFSEKHESCEPYEVRVPSCWFVRKPNARLVFNRTNNIYNGGVLVNAFNELKNHNFIAAQGALTSWSGCCKKIPGGVDITCDVYFPKISNVSLDEFNSMNMMLDLEKPGAKKEFAICFSSMRKTKSKQRRMVEVWSRVI